jgi:hypothetical protein
MALSKEFRTPTPLNSMDLQCGQRVENRLTEARVMILTVSFRRTTGRLASVRADGRRGVMREGVVAPTGSRAAGLPCCRQLFWCSQVGLGEPDPFLRPRYLALVPF